MADDIIPGDFDSIGNRLTVASAIERALQPKHPLARSHAAMVKELSTLHVPQFAISPSPEQFEDVADYLLRVAQIVDHHVQDIGTEAASNSIATLDKSQFANQCFSALEGNATFELDKGAEALRAEREDYRDETDYRRAMRAVLDRF